MTKTSDDSAGKGSSERGARGKSGRGRRDTAKFEWDEVDDVSQGDMLLPAKKKKRRPKQFEKIESTLTVGGPESDPYEIKKTPPRRPAASATLGGDDLAIPSYGKLLDEEDDEFSVFLRNAEKAEERERNRPQPEPKSGKKSGKKPENRSNAKSDSEMTSSSKEEKRSSSRNRPSRKERLADPSVTVSATASSESRPERKESVSREEKKTEDAKGPKTKRPERGAQNGGKRDVRTVSGRPKDSSPRETDSGAGNPPKPNFRPAENPLPSLKAKVAEIRDYGLDLMTRTGFSKVETDEFLSGISGIEKIVGLIDVLLHSSVARARESVRPEKDRPRPLASNSPETESFRPVTPVAEKADLPQSAPVPLPSKTAVKPAEPRSVEKEKKEIVPAEAKRKTPSRPALPPTRGDRRATFIPDDWEDDAESFETESVPASRQDGVAEKAPRPNREAWTFNEVPLSDPMLAMLNAASYEKPTPIQAGTIPQILSGRDIMGQSQTGSGKTAAFMIPIIERIEGCESGEDPLALIVVPTRELAVQIRDETVKLSRNREIITVACYGGKPIADQIKKMRGGVDIVVGTPGRILDLTKRRALSLAHLKWVVLDEADRMLDIGFRPDIERILKMTPSERQTLLFSATLADSVVHLAQRYMTDPETCDFSANDIASETIEQFYVTVDRERKFEALVRLLNREDPQQAIVFCRTKRGVDKLGRGLLREFKDWSISAIHGDLTQSSRDNIMRSFRAGKVKILVATDVVGRGIDVSGISHIINYDIPQFCDDYVHRVGRTGRMGREGVAYTLVTSQEGAELTRIEMRINRLLKRTELEGFEAYTRPDDLEKEEESKEPKAVFGKPLRRVRRAL